MMTARIHLCLYRLTVGLNNFSLSNKSGKKVFIEIVPVSVYHLVILLSSRQTVIVSSRDVGQLHTLYVCIYILSEF